MSLISQKLSSLQVGTPVKFTQRNGHTINGVVVENDGTESIAVQIMSTSFIRYDDISELEEVSGSAVQGGISAITKSIEPEQSNVPVADTVSDDKPVEIQPVDFSRETVRQQFRLIDGDAKKELAVSYDKYQSFLSSHDSSKLHEAVELIADVIDRLKLNCDKEVNTYFAYICMANNDFCKASLSFLSAKNIRYAYCSAFQGAEAVNDKELYVLSAVFASLYVIEENTDNLAETAEVIKICSEKTKDLGAVRYIARKSRNNAFSIYLWDIIKYLGKIHDVEITDFSDIEKCINSIQMHYPVLLIYNKFSDFKEFDKKTTDNAVVVTSESEKTNDEVASDVDTSKTYNGKISSYKFFEQSGIITGADGSQYPFEVSDVSDVTLQKQLKKTSKKDVRINVTFRLMKRMKGYCAVKIEKPQSEKNTKAVEESPKVLFKKKKYTEAIAGYTKMLETANWEEAFSQIIICYICLWNQKGDLGYSAELRKLVNCYKDKVSDNPNTLEALYQYNIKIQNYAESINLLNNMIERCHENEYSRILHYLCQKERCYYNLKDYQSAVSQLMDWLDIVERNKLIEQHSMRDNSIYPELAEVYLTMGDYENAEKYCRLSKNMERKKNIMNKLNAVNNADNQDIPTETDDEPDNEDEDIILDEQEENLRVAYDAYTDDCNFDSLNMTDIDIAEKISVFNENNLYSLLTYLHVASELSSSSTAEYTTDNDVVVNVGASVHSLSNAFDYAFNSPFLSKEYISTEIISVFEQSGRLLKDMNNRLFVGASLFALFSHQVVFDYKAEDLVIVVENSNLSDIYPTVEPLVNTLFNFKAKTSYGMDIFADYKTNSSVMDKIIAEANACCEAVDMRNGSFESQGQVRRTREHIFSDENSELRKCLDIAAHNDKNKLSYVKSRISEIFIRNGKPISAENIDGQKIDAYVDSYWELARDIIISEGRHVARPHDKIKSGKRMNIIATIRRILSCICDWIAIAENSENNDNIFAKEVYAETSQNVVRYLSELIQSCEKFRAENGFDWGNESIRYSATEILSKMNGTYDSRTRKYMFIEFLRGEDVLLNDKYLPEIRSTFCGWKNFNILSRIERHATHEHLSFEERITEILSEIESKHNFRTVQLIKNYAEDMNLDSISHHSDFAQLGECLRQAKQHFENVYHDFNDEMEMYESYGRISDINGEKTNLLRLALEWYKITRITNDYGFYARLLEVIRSKIALNALEKGRSLKNQLEELADKPEYDFGVYSKESIMAKIDDQNYTVAEHMLNCIRRHDTKDVDDYTAEPFGFFAGFMKEHPTNYRITYGSGEKLSVSVLKYALGFSSGGKTEENLVKAMKQLTNNAMKDVKGGCNLINNWIYANPAGTERIEKLLNLLEINNCTVTADNNNSYDSYMVYCKRQTGKVNYPHPIPAFSSSAQEEGFRVLCLYGKFNCKDLMETFRNINTVAKNTMVFLNYALNQDERRKLARQMKEEKTFARTFVVVDRVILMYLAKHYTRTDINKMLMAVTMPFAYYQPFVESSFLKMPPELFTGREAELTSIESPEGANLVYGGRQLGKSALLKMAQNNINGNANNDRAVLIDIKDRDYIESAKIVSSKLVVAGILDEGCQCDDWNVLSAHIEKRLLDDNPETRINYLLLMLDEADTFIGTSVVDGNIPITALKNLPPNRFKIVMAGLHNLSRYNRNAVIGNNSTLIHLNSIIVRPFQRPEAIKLLTNTLAYLGFRFQPDVISLILAKTNYFPGLIQLYCQKLIEAMREDYAGYSEISTPSYEVTESHFKKVLSDSQFMDKVNKKLESTLFAEESDHSYYHIIAVVLSFLCYTENSDKGYNIDDIFRIAGAYNITRLKNISHEQLDELLHEMWDLNVLTCEDGYYRFATESFREMLGKQDTVEKIMGEYCGEGENA